MRQLATIQKIEELKPIAGADKIEAARVKGWWVVVKKDEFKIGDRCVYFEIDSLLPDEVQYEFLKRGSTLKRANFEGEVRTGIRLKTIKLKGQISQGLVMPESNLISEYGHDLYEENYPVGTDVSEELNVIKYEPPIPAVLAGLAKGFFPNFIPKTDEERIQNMSEVLSSFYVTEKLDGSSITYYKKDNIFGVCTRNLELKEGETTPWRIAKELNLAEKLPDNFAIQGELVGEGIQKNPLKISGHKVYFFNAYDIDTSSYLNFENFKMVMESIGVQTVPIIDENFSLPKTMDEMLEYAEGRSMLNPNVEREGVVVRPKEEMNIKGQRFSFKAISNKFLLGEEE